MRRTGSLSLLNPSAALARWRARRSEAGDTLIEVLVAVAIVALTVVALLGSLLTSTSASVTGRGIANLDGILQSFAESARYQIQTQPEDGTVGPLFQPCTASYPLASDPYPDAAPPSTPIAVFVVGFPENTAVQVSVGGASVTNLTSGTTTNASGDTMVVFPAPSTGGRVTVSAGGTVASSETPFTAEPAGSPSPGLTAANLSGYSLTESVGPYNGDCTHQQLVKLALTDPEPGNAASASLNFVVADFSPQPVVLSVAATDPTSGAPTSSVPAEVLVTAYVTSRTGAAVQTGTVDWTISSPVAGYSPACQSSTLSATSGPATCAFAPSYGQEGTYIVTATYSGPSYPNGSSSSSTVVLTRPSPSVLVTVAPGSNGPPCASGCSTPKGDLVFTATVSPPTTSSPWPGTNATMAWAISATDGSTPACTANSGPSGSPSPGTAATYTCTLASPVTFPDSYTVSAHYSGNTDYAPSLGQLSLTVPALAVGNVQQSVGTNNTQVTYTLTVTGLSGDQTPTGTPSVTVSPAPGKGTPSCTVLTGSGDTATSKCTFTGANTTLYSVTTTYGGDANYAPAEAVFQEQL